MKETYTIYAFQHNVTKKIYIGSTDTPVEDRYRWHIADLKKKKHKSQELQKDFEEYGNDFSVFILETGKNRNIKHPYYNDKIITQKAVAEYTWMDKYNSINSEYGYNSNDRTAKAFIRRKRACEEVRVNIKTGLPQAKE